MIIGSLGNVTIRDFEEKDCFKKVEWINDPQNNRYLHYDLPLEINNTIKWFREKNNDFRIDCIIQYQDMAVGLIGLLGIDKHHNDAEYYIVLGEHQLKNKGISKIASQILLNYAFNMLKLKNVHLTVEEQNVQAQKLYEKLGFRQDREKQRTTLFYSLSSSMYNKKLFFNDTPIQKLGDYNNNEVYIKRDDLIPFSFGGNKARKAVNFFDDIDHGDFDCVITYGSCSSNHCRIVSNMAAQRNLPCLIISPQEACEPTFNSKMMSLLGAEFVVVPTDDVHDTIEKKISDLKAHGHKPYFIAGGGHGNLGTQAYVDCYQEIKDYECKNDVVFDYIFLASGTGTTQAGLVCGKLIHGDEKMIVGISIARKNPRGRQIIVESVIDYFKESNRVIDESAILDSLFFIDDYVDLGYGRYNDDVIEVIGEVFVKFGIPLDATYTGKAFDGMNKYTAANKLHGKRLLYIHTGGTPLFFDSIK